MPYGSQFFNEVSLSWSELQKDVNDYPKTTVSYQPTASVEPEFGVPVLANCF